MHFRYTFAAIALGLVSLLGACSGTDDEPQPPAASDHLALGNPSGGASDPSQPTNYLLLKKQYALSYHRTRGTATWVSWHLDASWLGQTPRQDDFRPDDELPAGWYRATSSSYSGSGFDRGHLCPSADRTRTPEDNSATFLMTNMVPQAPRLNQQPWARLEEYCRTLVGRGNELYIISGAYGRGGVGASGPATTLDQGRVTVPAQCWKVVVVLPTGADDARRVSTSTRIIAVNMPNDNDVDAAWSGYRVSVDAIEAATGLDLLSAVPGAVQAEVEKRVDTGPVQ